MFTTRPELTGDHGMVASTHWLASAVGMSVLERGGNAFDAAAAAGFVLQVVEPHLNGPGGEVPILLWSEAQARVSVICGQGVAPAAASVEAMTELGLDIMPGAGLLAATVPGAFGGWLRMLRQYGTWALRDVLEPAISYADRGFPAVAGIVNTIGVVEGLLRNDWPTSAAIWLPGGTVPAEGDRLRNEVLAQTYKRVVEHAESATSDRDRQLDAALDAWYRGFVAEEIARFCAQTQWRDTSDEPHGGLLTGDDLASWAATEEDPVTLDYHGYTVCKTGPWGQGPVFLQQLALLRHFDLETIDSAEYVHTVVECAKLAFADREAFYGDPNFVDVPLKALLSDEYSRARAALLTATANNELRPGSPEGREPVLPSMRTDLIADPSRGASDAPMPDGVGVGEPTLQSDGRVRGDTCHLDVADRFGNMVSATPSGGWLQSSPVIPSLGFCLGTRGQMFRLEKGLPSTLRPGSRPRTTLTPSFALRDGRPWLAFGTPGGDQQDQWSLQLFLSLVHGGMNLQEAIDAPAFHSVHFPSSFYPRLAQPGGLVIEDRVGEEVVGELRRRGHKVTVEGPWTLGRLSAVARDADFPGAGFLRAAANPRGAQGYAAGR